MPLLLWAPLTTGIVNNTIENQGLSPAIFNRMNHNGKIAGNTNGKLGMCIERTASGYADCYRSSVNFNLTGDVSMMCWAYVSATIGDTANGLITNHNHADNSGLGITVKQVSTSDYRISCSTGNGSTRTYMTYYGTTNIKNAWHHLALTYNKSKKILKLYVDGNCEYTLTNYDNYAANNPFDLFNWSTGHYTNGDYRPVCKLNDVRLYDNELSQAEVKKISRGLISHIAMNGGRSNPNLFKGTAMTAAERASTGFVVNNSTDWTKPFRFYNGAANLHSFTDNIDTVTLSQYANLGVAFTRKATDIGLDSSSYYTISCEAKCTKTNATLDIGLSYYNNSNAWVWRGGSNPQAFKNNTDWQKFSLTFKPDSDTQYTCYCITVVGTDGGTDKFYIRNCKLEKGSVATPWCPAMGDIEYNNMGFNSYDEQDISGFRNKAIKYGSVAFSYTDNSPRNSTCITFANNSHIYINSLKTTAEYVNIYSFAWWGKTTTSEGKMMWGLANGNRCNLWWPNAKIFCWNTGDSEQNPFGTTSTAPYIDGNWHHFAVTSNGSVVKLYIDGVYKADAKTWKGLGTATNIAFNGWALSSDYNFNGSLSDWRMYATCLSADDVKELYSVGASITDNGTILANEFVEN